MTRLWLRAGALLLLVGARTLYAQDGSASWKDHFVAGECILEADPAQKAPWPVVCTRARLSYQGISRSELHERNVNYAYGDAYLGLHVTNIFSLHAQAAQAGFFHPVETVEKVTENLFLQIGNVAWSRARFSVGRLDLPFGLNLRPLLDVYDAVYKTDRFWESARYAARFAFEDLTNTQIDFGFASDEVNQETEPGEEKRYFQMSARVMIDIPALGGTRFVFSGFDEPEMERRLSAGLLTRDPTGGLTAFEWVRLFPKEAGAAKKFAQLLRLNYSGNAERPSSWLFEYEDELRKHFLTTIGFNHRLTNFLRVKLNVSYYRARTLDDVNHWLLASGVEWHL